MAPRPRNRGNKDLPDNLYPRKDKRTGKTYYAYRDPKTRREFGLGTDKAKAVREARAANLALLAEQPTLIERMTKSAYTLSEWLTEYRRIIQEERDLSAATIRNYLMRLNTIEGWLGSKPLEEVTTLDFTERFRVMTKEGKAQMVKALRSLASDVFREAIADGRCKVNPLAVTKAPRITVTRERLTLEMWKAIYECAEAPWLKRAMELALVTGQRREDIAAMKFSDIKDGKLHVIQSKTKAKIRIPEALRLNAIELSLADVVKRCRDNVVSQYLVHHHKNTGRAERGQAIVLDTLSRLFADAREEAVRRGLIVVSGSPPTFHEMRSLASRLHKAEGHDTKTLLGHKNENMASTYQDSRGWEWLEVAAQ